MDMSMYQTIALMANVGGMQAAQNFESAFPLSGNAEGAPDFQAMLESFLTAGSIANPDADVTQATLSDSILAMADFSGSESIGSIVPNLLQGNIQSLMGTSNQKQQGTQNGDFILSAGMTNFDALKNFESLSLASAERETDKVFKAPDAANLVMQSALKAQTETANSIMAQISSEMKAKAEEANGIAEAIFPMMNMAFERPIEQMSPVTENVAVTETIIPQKAIADEMQISDKEISIATPSHEDGKVSGFEKVLKEAVPIDTRAEMKESTENEVISPKEMKAEIPEMEKNAFKFENEKPQMISGKEETLSFEAKPKESVQQTSEKAMKAPKDEEFEAIQNLNAEGPEKTWETKAPIQAEKTQQTARPAYVQVSERVEAAITKGEDGFTMKLAPEGLGEITVKLAKIGEKVSITIAATSPETHRLLAANSEKLAENLGLSNIRVEGIKVETEIGRDEIVTNEAAKQNFDASADRGEDQSQGQSRNASHAKHHYGSDVRETVSIEEMSETYRMLKDRIGMLNYLA